MPNHVSQHLTLTGEVEARDTFIQKCFTTRHTKRELDFNSLIPQPSGLDIESGTETSIGYFAITGKTLGLPMVHILDYPWIKRLGITTREHLYTWLAENRPAALKAGAQARDNIDAHGYPTWYEWSRANWGTKWNAYETRLQYPLDNTVKVSFETAWSVPEPFLHALAAAFPTLTGDYVCFDEGWNFAGVGSMADGRFTLTDTTPSDEMYQRVYGHPPHLDENA